MFRKFLKVAFVFILQSRMRLGRREDIEVYVSLNVE